jgi:hypothetical protein
MTFSLKFNTYFPSANNNLFDKLPVFEVYKLSCFSNSLLSKIPVYASILNTFL